jgi:hypothetical protein
MANVLLTSKCNRACTFCFAAEEVTLAGNKGAPQHADWAMSLETVDKLIDFHKRSHTNQISLLGGEPTIHPEFNEILDRIMAAGLTVKLFTGGLIPPKVKEHIKTMDPKRLSIIANISSLDGCRSVGEFQAITGTVRELAEYCSLSFTITRPDFDTHFHPDLITQTGCRPHIRLGLELPMLTDPNPRLDPSAYRETAKTIIKMGSYANDRNISLGFDCGFVMCMFTSEELGLLRLYNSHAEFRCTPIIDINPKLEVWACFATSPLHRVKIEETTTRDELNQHFLDKQRPYRIFGVFDDCEDCLYKARGQCGGGCLSFVIRNFQGSGYETQNSPVRRAPNPTPRWSLSGMPPSPGAGNGSAGPSEKELAELVSA